MLFDPQTLLGIDVLTLVTIKIPLIYRTDSFSKIIKCCSVIEVQHGLGTNTDTAIGEATYPFYHVIRQSDIRINMSENIVFLSLYNRTHGRHDDEQHQFTPNKYSSHYVLGLLSFLYYKCKNNILLRGLKK